MLIIVEESFTPQKNLLSSLKVPFSVNIPIIISGTIVLGVAIVGGIIILQRRFRSTKKDSSVYSSQLSTTRNFKKLYYPGLRNIGNSCYLNCILQALASARPVLIANETLHTRPFILELHGLLSVLNTPQTYATSYDAKILVSQMGGVLNGEQQDAHELLQAILSVLSKDIMKNRSSDSLGVEDLRIPSISHTYSSSSGAFSKEYHHIPWEGILMTKIQCTCCGKTSGSGTRAIDFSILTLQLADTLIDSFHTTFAPDHLSGYQCANCLLTDGCYKIEGIVRWPKILILHLQRSIASGGMLVKDDRYVKFPLIFSNWNWQCYQIIIEQKCPSYKLCAIVEHLGSLGGGHYVTYRRVNGDAWLCCSDTSITAVPLARVLRANAYILLYTKS